MFALSFMLAARYAGSFNGKLGAYAQGGIPI